MQITSDDLILVTGATGLVGSHVAEQAAQRGFRVRALVRRTADLSFLSGLNIELIYGDLDQPATLRAACVGASIVIHCAAKVGDWGQTDEYRRINVTGSANENNTEMVHRLHVRSWLFNVCAAIGS